MKEETDKQQKGQHFGNVSFSDGRNEKIS